MGGQFSKLLGRISSRGEINLVMVGLDGAGKTTILRGFKDGEFTLIQPSPGLNVERLTYENITVTSWSVGGQNSRETFWRRDMGNVHALIFVLDSTDGERILEARDELQRVVNEVCMKDAPLLVLANKQDCSHTISFSDITKLLGLDFYEQNWYITGADALSLKGLYDAFFWLCKNIFYKD